MNDFDSKRGSFILENHQPNVEEKKIIDNAFLCLFLLSC